MTQKQCDEFNKLQSAAAKFEKHLAYNDTHYLWYNVDGLLTVIELIDPGIEHTGAREMSIRKADGAILFYNVTVPESFRRLYDVLHDFELRQRINYKPPIVLIGNDDEFGDGSCPESASIARSSVSEGYESEPVHPLSVTADHNNCSNVQSSPDDSRVTNLQAERLSKSLGPNCRFIAMSASNFDGTQAMIEELIRAIRLEKKTTQRKFFRRFKSQKKQQAVDGTSRKITTRIISQVCALQ